ncbi:phosphatidate cytidylyltransferase [Piscibacillus halophilus]|mgnify:CR=1 FL=1|uniref:Phosphatidate cytidylyltransferase n=1 Tax=Piscibacillus halophilus TaxID=571933 RepID=A0A1H9F6Y2_9BACI|nr:phosphatidate cytidylyltransferase [Piscibacillus halophilus]SEQ33625.1 phosphatidate cytidylyltransferase [Piscibacillus halophilus]
MTETIWTLSILLFVLTVATTAFYIIKKKQPHKDFTTIQSRVVTWWGMLVVFSFATLFNPLVSLISIMVLCLVALREYFSMMQTRKSDRRLFLWAYLTIPFQFYWIYIGWYGMFIIFIPVYVFLFLPLPRIFGKGTLGFLRSVSFTQWGLMLMVFGLSHLSYYSVASPEYGPNLVLFLIVLTQFNDVVQYIVSIYIGKNKVVPTANPYITWEGFFVALLTTTAVSYYLYPYLTVFDLTFGILSGVLISVTGFLGCVTISFLKRDLLINDHKKQETLKGRYLSRVDSLAYTSPVFFHVIRYFFDFM